MFQAFKNSRWVERLYPIIVGSCAGIISWKFRIFPPENSYNDLLSALLSASSIAVGFLTAALSILLPIAATHVGQQLAKKGLKKDLVHYLREAIFSCLSLSGICVVGFFMVSGGKYFLVFFGLLVFLSVYSALSLIRVAEILLKLFSRASDPEDKQG